MASSKTPDIFMPMIAPSDEISVNKDSIALDILKEYAPKVIVATAIAALAFFALGRR